MNVFMSFFSQAWASTWIEAKLPQIKTNRKSQRIGAIRVRFSTPARS